MPYLSQEIYMCNLTLYLPFFSLALVSYEWQVNCKLFKVYMCILWKESIPLS